MGSCQSTKKLGGRGMLDVDLVQSLSLLEDGHFAKLYKGRMSFGSATRTVTIKVPRVSDAIRKDRREVKKHIEEVRKLLPLVNRSGIGKSDNLVKYVGVAYDDFRKEVWVVREYVDGLDLEMLMKSPSLCPALGSPEKRIGIAIGIARGMNYLHSLKTPTVHGDFTPSDVMIANDGFRPKITNFGLWELKRFFVENAFQDSTWSPVLTNPWQAPEVLIGRERPTMFSDSWSLSMTLLQWLTERPGPWDFDDLCSRYGLRHNRKMAALMQAMQNGEDPSVRQSGSDDEDLAILRDALVYEPTKRPLVHKIEAELVAVSSTPTWTNLAYHKYYGQS